MASPGAAHSLTTSFGATLLGTFFSSILYGLTVHQTYRYYRQYTVDRISLKTLVFVLWLLDTLQTLLAMHTSYVYLVNNFDNPSALLVSNWSFRLSILVVAGPPFLSNGFYVSRLWIIGMRNIPFLLAMGALMLTRTSFQLILAAMAWVHPTFSEFRKYYWMVQAYCGASLVADILLAVYFSWTLHKRRTGYARTDSKIDLLMIYSINTGSLTSLICLLSLMSLVFLNTGFVYVGLHYLLGKLYVNSVLAVLNSRKPRHRLDDSVYEIAAFDAKASAESKPGKIIFRRATDDTTSPIDFQFEDETNINTHVESGMITSALTESTLQNTGRIELEKP